MLEQYMAKIQNSVYTYEDLGQAISDLEDFNNLFHRFSKKNPGYIAEIKLSINSDSYLVSVKIKK